MAKMSDTIYDHRNAEAANPETAPERLEELARDPQLVVLVSANPAAPAELLKRLAQGDDQDVRAAVAANPNAPWDALLGLALSFPESFMANPAVPLLLLEEPGRVTQLTNLSVEAALSLLRSEFMPDWLIAVMSQHRRQWVREAVMHHICVAGEAPDECAALGALSSAWMRDDELAGLFMLPLDHPADWLLELLAGHADPLIRQAIASRADIPQTLLERSLVDYEPRVRKGVASHPDLPLDIYARLIDDTDANVRQVAARNMLMQLPNALVEHLARSSKAALRRIAALHPGLDLAILEQLAGDDNIAVRRCVALNPSTPLATLEKIMEGETTWLVRLAVAGHPNASASLLEQLATDGQWAVRHDVFWNPHASNEAMNAILQKDGLTNHVIGFGPIPERMSAFLSHHVGASKLRSIMQKSANRSYQPAKRISEGESLSADAIIALAGQGDPSARYAIAENPHTPSQLLALLVRDGHSNIQYRVARNPNTPPCVLAYLSEKNSALQSDIVQNPSTPYIVSALLGDAKDARVRYAARVACNNKAVRLMATDHHEPELSAESCRQLLSMFLQGTSAETSLRRVLALSHLTLTAEMLAKEAQSLAWPERYIIACHPHVDQSTLETLARDSNRFVRAAARKRLRM
jgi:hypothetical protein